MGAASSIKADGGTAPTQLAASPPSIPFPQNGVRLCVFKDFINSNGGKKAFLGLSTTDVCEKFLLPLTKNLGISYCELIRQEGNPNVGPASIFISHAWKLSFLDVVSVLALHFDSELSEELLLDEDEKNEEEEDDGDEEEEEDEKDELKEEAEEEEEEEEEEDEEEKGMHKEAYEYKVNRKGGKNNLAVSTKKSLRSSKKRSGSNRSKDAASGRGVGVVKASSTLTESDGPILWFDLFSNNQHATPERNLNWWSNIFKSSIAQFGHVVMVLSPWYDPVPFTRTWCLFELYCAEVTNSRFEVAMSDSERAEFMRCICRDYSRYIRMLRDVDVRRTKSFNPSDREDIFEMVTQTIGFEKFNSKVANIMLSWALEALEESANAAAEMVKVKLPHVTSAVGRSARNGAAGVGALAQSMKSEYSAKHFIAAAGSSPAAFWRSRLTATSIMIEQKAFDRALEALKLLVKDFNRAFTTDDQQLVVLGHDYDDAPDTTVSTTTASTSSASTATTAISTTAALLAAKTPTSALVSAVEDDAANMETTTNYINDIVPDSGDGKSEKYPPPPFLASVYSNMATVFAETVRYADALTYHQKALDLIRRQQEKSQKHPVKTAAPTVKAPAGWSRAVSSDSSTETSKSLPQRPDVASILSSIAQVHIKQGDLSQALHFEQQALKVRTGLFGDVHTEVGQSHQNMGDIAEQQGRFTDALTHLEQALLIRQRCDGVDHPAVGLIQNSIGLTCYKQQQYKHAAAAFEQALQILHASVGDRHLFVAKTLNNFALVKTAQGKHDDALTDYNRVLKIMLHSFGSQHQFVATAYNNIALVYDGMKQYDQALSYYDQSLKIMLATVGNEHPATATAHANIAAVYCNQGKFEEAIKTHEIVLKIRRKAFGTEKHPSIATTYANMGSALCGLLDFRGALPYCEKALQIRQGTLGSSHPQTVSIAGVVRQLRDELKEEET